MPATFVPDTVESSMVELFGNSAESAVRTGIVHGLPTTGNPEDVLWNAMTAAGMPATGTPYPGRSNCWLTRIQVFGMSHDVARVKLVYEAFQGVGTSLIIDIGSQMASYATNMHPKTKEAFAVDFIAQGDKAEDIPTDYVTMNILRPMRRVSVTQLRSGTLTPTEAISFGDNIGKTNDAAWLGKPIGAWLITAATASISRYGGYYQRRIEAMNQGSDLWSYYGILRSQMTGRFAGGAKGSSDDLQPTIDNLKAMPYPVGVYAAQGLGVIRVDPYETTTYSPLFGF